MSIDVDSGGIEVSAQVEVELRTSEQEMASDSKPSQPENLILEYPIIQSNFREFPVVFYKPPSAKEQSEESTNEEQDVDDSQSPPEDAAQSLSADSTSQHQSSQDFVRKSPLNEEQLVGDLQSLPKNFTPESQSERASVEQPREQLPLFTVTFTDADPENGFQSRIDVRCEGTTAPTLGSTLDFLTFAMDEDAMARDDKTPSLYLSCLFSSESIPLKLGDDLLPMSVGNNFVVITPAQFKEYQELKRLKSNSAQLSEPIMENSARESCSMESSEDEFEEVAERKRKRKADKGKRGSKKPRINCEPQKPQVVAQVEASLPRISDEGRLMTILALEDDRAMKSAKIQPPYTAAQDRNLIRGWLGRAESFFQLLTEGFWAPQLVKKLVPSRKGAEARNICDRFRRMTKEVRTWRHGSLERTTTGLEQRLCEIGLTLPEASAICNGLTTLMQEKKVKTSEKLLCKNVIIKRENNLFPCV